MKNKIFCFILSLAACLVMRAQTTTAPTWSSDIQCIFYSHCTYCHNPGGIAPLSLITYQDALQNMSDIIRDVSDKKMPPYLPNPNYQHYTDMRILTTQEINTIIAWADSGGPAGDTSHLLPQPVYASGPVLTHPDITARIPNFIVPNTGTDLYQCFILTNPQDSARFIKTIEIIPGNAAAVHHVLVFEDTAYAIVQEDSASPGPGFVSFGSTGSATSILVGAWVPGAGIDSVPPDMGIQLQKGARIILQIHYPVTSQGLLDSTRINIQYTTDNNVRNVSVEPVLNYYSNMTDGPLVIPANSVKTFHEQFTVPADATVLSVAPHGHLVCSQLKSFAVTPANDTIPLIEIDDWDFHWQGAHSFQRPIKVPAQSVLYGIGTYNNTTSNTDAPLPISTVYAGEATTNEMMLFFFWYLPYQAGDENIIVDTASQPHYMDCISNWQGDNTGTGIPQVPVPANVKIFPNPNESILNYQSDIDITSIIITDVDGKVVKQISGSGKEGKIPVAGMANGLYFISFQNENGKVQTLNFTKD